jgi:hypothetical protein
MTNDCIFLATNKNELNQVNSFIFEKAASKLSYVPMQDTFLFEEMQGTHESQKNKIDIDEFITGTTNMTQKTNLVIHNNVYSMNLYL